MSGVTGPRAQQSSLPDIPIHTSLPSLWHYVASHLCPPLTSSELRGQVALAQLLPALPTMGQLHVACHFQDGETQTRGG